MRLKYIGLLLLAGFLGSCAQTGSPAWYSHQMKVTIREAQENNQLIQELKIGMSKKEVVELMGSPNKTEAYAMKGNKTVEFLFYRTQGWRIHDDSDGDHQFTPFTFVNDKLEGWGRNYYNRILKQEIDIKVDK